jgi:DNA-binding cell septation regulator SpoVG
MLINVSFVGPSSQSKALAKANVEIVLHNGDQIDRFTFSDLQIRRQPNAVDDLLFVAFPASRQADGKWMHLISASTRLRRKIEDAVLEAYDRWCDAQPNCANSDTVGNLGSTGDAQ